MVSTNKGALSLLTIYGSDYDSDEDVPGPRVSTKRTRKSDSEESTEEPHLKKLERLPVPDVLKEKAADINEHIDNPVLHGGKIRTFAHERGNWATYVYIPFTKHEGIEELIHTIIDTIHDKNIKINEIDYFHISLTRTVILKHHWINSFVDSIKLRTNGIRKFMILFGDLKIFCNDERTRTFIGLQIRTGYDSLLKLVEMLDKCLEDFSLPTFYDNPSFHMSIAWCVGDYEDELNLLLPQLNCKLQELMDTCQDDCWYIYVESLFCKTGNKFYNFFLT